MDGHIFFIYFTQTKHLTLNEAADMRICLYSIRPTLSNLIIHWHIRFTSSILSLMDPLSDQTLSFSDQVSDVTYH